MSSLLTRFKQAFTRPGRPGFGGVGGLPDLPQNAAGEPIVKSLETGLYPVQFSVIHRISTLAMLIQLRSDSMVMRKPETFLTFPSWIQKVVYLLLTDETMSICAIRDPRTNKIIEYHAFADSIKPTKNVNGAYVYAENDVIYEVMDEWDILQFSSTAAMENKSLKVVIQHAEDAYWRKFHKIDRLRGLVSYEEEGLGGRLPGEQEAITLTKMAEDMSKLGFGVLPAKTRYVAPQGGAAIDVEQKAIMRQWCWHYGLPPSIMSLDLPTHKDQSLSAAFGMFLRQCLQGLVEPVFRGIEAHSGATIVEDYKRIERASDTDLAETTMTLAQSSVFYIDEIRENVYGARPLPNGDGQAFPQVAGAPDTDEETNDEGGSEDD